MNNPHDSHDRDTEPDNIEEIEEIDLEALSDFSDEASGVLKAGDAAEPSDTDFFKWVSEDAALDLPGVPMAEEVEGSEEIDFDSLPDLPTAEVSGVLSGPADPPAEPPLAGEVADEEMDLFARVEDIPIAEPSDDLSDEAAGIVEPPEVIEVSEAPEADTGGPLYPPTPSMSSLPDFVIPKSPAGLEPASEDEVFLIGDARANDADDDLPPTALDETQGLDLFSDDEEADFDLDVVAADVLNSDDDGRADDGGSPGDIELDIEGDSDILRDDSDILRDESGEPSSVDLEGASDPLVMSDLGMDDEAVSEVQFASDFDADYDIPEEPIAATERTSEEVIDPTVSVADDGTPVSASDLSKYLNQESGTRAEAPGPERPAEPVAERPRRRGGATVLAGILGVLVGAGGVAGAWFAGLLPDDSGRGSQGSVSRPMDTPPATADAPPMADSADRAWQLLAAGRTPEALEAFESLGDADADALSGRGQARWLIYLRGQARRDEPLDGTAEEVDRAREELGSAADMGEGVGSVRAQLWLGLIEETLGNVNKARSIYDQGREKFPDHGRVFETALGRMELTAEPAGPVSMRPAEALLGLAILLQADPNDAGDDEPGFAFWDALRKAAVHDYDAALAALNVAEESHRRQRLELAGRGLNPLSDPMNEIFLRSCRQLEEYWTVRRDLYGLPGAADLVARGDGYPALVGEMVAERDRVRRLLAVDKLDEMPLPQAVIELQKLRDTLAVDKKALDERIAALAKSLADAGLDDPKPEDALASALKERKAAGDAIKELSVQLAEAGFEDAEPLKALGMLLVTKRDAERALESAARRLREGGFPAPEGDLLAAVDAALTEARKPAAADLLPPAQGAMAGGALSVARALASGRQLEQARERIAALDAKLSEIDERHAKQLADQRERHERILKQVREPAAMLAIWADLLSDPDNARPAEEALADAERVIADEGAAPEHAAQARAVKGLALRNQGDFAGARRWLNDAGEAEGFDADSAWGRVAAEARAELTDPAALLRRIAAAPADRASRLAGRGLEVFPADEFAGPHAKMLVKRALARIEAGELEAAKADADRAVELGEEVEGNFALAKVAERAGERLVAERGYRRVIKLAPEGSETAREARLALTRLLLGGRGPVGKRVTPAEVPSPEAAHFVAFQAPAVDDTDAVREALTLADELIRAGEPRGHLFKADSLSKLGRHTEALKEYSAGLRGLRVLSADELAILDGILARHPDLQRPEQEIRPQPDRAFTSYARGIDHFHAGRFEEAEQAFRDAVRYFDQDARYQYYLGLSRWMLGQEAIAVADFRRAADLERLGRPETRQVSQSLERVQGPVRRVVGGFRP